MASHPPTCPFCGAAGDPGDRFCQTCGREMAGPAAAGVPPPLPISPPPPPLLPPPLPASFGAPPPSSRSGVPGWAIAIIAAGGMAVLGMGGWLGYRFLAPRIAPTRETAFPTPPPAAAEEPPPAENFSGGMGAEPPAEEPASLSADRPSDESLEPAVVTAPEPAAPAVQAPPRERRDKPAPASSAKTSRPSKPPTAPPPVSPPTPSTPPDIKDSASEPGPQQPPPHAPVEPAVAFSRTYECRRYAEFHVDPEEALVTIDGVAIGKADRWDGMPLRKGYQFPGEGSYTVKLSLPGYRTEWVRIVVKPEAKKKTAKVDLKLARE